MRASAQQKSPCTVLFFHCSLFLLFFFSGFLLGWAINSTDIRLIFLTFISNPNKFRLVTSNVNKSVAAGRFPLVVRIVSTGEGGRRRGEWIIRSSSSILKVDCTSRNSDRYRETEISHRFVLTGGITCILPNLSQLLAEAQVSSRGYSRGPMDRKSTGPGRVGTLERDDYVYFTGSLSFRNLVSTGWTY